MDEKCGSRDRAREPAPNELLSQKAGGAGDENLHMWKLDVVRFFPRHVTVRLVSTPLRVAIVTGAGSGIGRAVALGLLARRLCGRVGGPPAGSARRDRAVGECAANEPWPSPTDVTDPRVGRALFTQDAIRIRPARRALQQCRDVARPVLAVDDLTVEQWRAVVDVNLTGVFLCTQQAFRLMKAQQPRGGRIINNGSLAAHVPRPHSAPYAATKHAVTGLTKATALDGRAWDICCSQIDIGNAKTAMAAKHAVGALQPNGEIAVEPMLDLEHVVAPCVYMAGLPLDANVPFLTVMATKMPYVGRG